MLILAVTAACDSQIPDEANMPVTRIPAQVCSQATDGIKKLSESGGFTSAGSAEGTIDGEVWLKMSEPQRDQLLQLLAVSGACTAAEPPTEVTATVRDETGRVLSQRVIETSADLSRLNNE